MRPGGKFDTLASTVMMIINTVPTNALAIILLLVLATSSMGRFPISGITSGRPERLG